MPVNSCITKLDCMQQTDKEVSQSIVVVFFTSIFLFTQTQQGKDIYNKDERILMLVNSCIIKLDSMQETDEGVSKSIFFSVLYFFALKHDNKQK